MCIREQCTALNRFPAERLLWRLWHGGDNNLWVRKWRASAESEGEKSGRAPLCLFGNHHVSSKGKAAGRPPTHRYENVLLAVYTNGDRNCIDGRSRADTPEFLSGVGRVSGKLPGAFALKHQKALNGSGRGISRSLHSFKRGALPPLEAGAVSIESAEIRAMTNRRTRRAGAIE
jgi:hypothetical protein